MKMPVSSARRAAVVAACAGLALLASACASTAPGSGGGGGPAGNGISAKPVVKIVKTSFTTFEAAKSVRVYGSFRDSGAHYKLDITMGPTGMRGSMTAPFIGSKVGTADMVVAHGKFYARSRNLWRQVGGAQLASLIGDRWVVIPAGSMSGFPFANAKTFVTLMRRATKSLNSSTASANKAQTTVNGQPAVELSDDGAAVYVATTGNPYLLEIRQGSSALYFQYTGLKTAIAPPPHPLDLTKMQSGG